MLVLGWLDDMGRAGREWWKSGAAMAYKCLQTG
jgi:hypothetical protein